MSINKRWFLALSINEDNKPITLSVSSRTGKFLLSSFVVFVFLIVASIIFISIKSISYKNNLDLMKENNYLHMKLREMSSEIDSIVHKQETIEEWENSLREDNKLKPIDKDIRRMGTGGIPVVDSLFKTKDEILKRDYHDILRKLENTSSRIEFDFTAYQDLKNYLDLKEDYYAHTPSVYPTFGRISSKFGRRKRSIYKKVSYHHGIDFGNKKGTPIYATADGTIKKTGRLRKFGKYIYIKHKYGYETRYAHLNKYIVKKGEKVTKGQIIGYMGNTGRSNGSHLHYEVVRYGKRVNPYTYLTKSKDDIKVAYKN